VASGRFRVRRLILSLLLLSLTAYVIWDRIEAAGLSREIAQIAQRGEPVHPGDGLPNPSTPEQREASRLYAQAARFAQEQSAEDNNRASRIDVEKPAIVEMILPEIVAAYRDDAPALQLLDRATPLDFGGFEEEAQMSSVYELPLTGLGALACLRADLAAVRGDGDAAAAALVPCVGLQRTLIRTAYRAGHATRVLGSLRILFRHTQPADASLVTLQRAFETWPDEDVVLRDLLEDRARLIDTSDDGLRGSVPPVVRILFHPFMLRSVRRGIASFEPFIAISRRPWPARWQAAAEIERSYARMMPPSRRGLLARLTDPLPIRATGMALGRAGQELAARRVAIAVIAIERFRRAHGGALPASLDALAPALLPAVPQDPFSDAPLLYRHDEEGYVVYSVDVNRRDEGGVLYGHGSAVGNYMGSASRDLGIRVSLASQH
jgi:hypothetical protein